LAAHPFGHSLADVIPGLLKTLLGGFLMGTADLIPGVSGGTIALVLGIYRRLVSSIKQGSSALGAIIRLAWAEAGRHLRAVEWGFIIPLLVGIVAAVVLLSRFLEHQLETRPVILAAAFFGLVLASTVYAWRMIEHPTGRQAAIAAVVGIVLFTLLGFGPSEAASDPGLLIFAASGALAVCAMILPGISGSLTLVLIGMYGAALAAVTSRDIASILALLAGATIGLALFSQFLNWALDRHHDTVLAAMVGLLAGSLRILWPWPDGLEGAALGPPGPDWPPAILAAGLGMLVIVGISRLAGSPRN
jgi:putative membrane protein